MLIAEILDNYFKNLSVQIMKKIFYLASAAAVLFAGCAKDDTEALAPVSTDAASVLSASVYTGEVTRTYLGEDRKFRWSAGDAIGVFDNGTNSAQNVVFSLPNECDGQENGKFVSMDHKLLCGKTHFAYYPYTVNMKKAASADDLELTILANQNFRDGSFTPMTAPAVCPEFTVEEVDGVGEANITMYPVADYLNVAIEGTAPIKTLTLSMSSDAEGTEAIYLAGTAKLTPVGSKDAGYAEGFRQYLTVPADAESTWSPEITLTCGQLTDALCHTEKEYMFVIPANVVAKAKNTPVYVKIVVNKGEKNEVTFTKELVYTSARPQLSNMIFNVNDGKDKDGNIIPLMYNPSNAVIIKDQLDLLTYIREYNEGTKADAFLCSVAELDFSRDAMIKISTEMGGQNADISNYLANGFPCIKSFSNTITGNGAVIKDVQIDDMNGIFGELAEGAAISGITFENVTAAKDKDVYGVLLTKNAAGDAKIEDITIKNCTASAIFGEVRPSGLAKLNVVVDEGQNKNIASVAEELRMNEDLALKNVTDFNVSGPLFGKVGFGAGHRVLSVEEACEVSDLLGTMKGNIDDGGVYSILIAGTSYWTGGAVQATKTNTKGEVEILYAEQLAYAAQSGATSVILMNNMELNGSIVEKDNHPYIWKRDSANAIASINGNGKTVSDVYMQSSEAEGVQADLAPFTADAISNLNVDGVKIYIITDEDTFVPAKVAGLSLKSNSVSKVTVNNIDIEGVYDGLNKGDIAYAASMQPYVGLLLAEAEDAQLSECVVAGKSNIKGYIGSLVGYATLKEAEKEMQVYDCTATLSIDPTAVSPMKSATETLQEFENDYNTSYYGQPIGVLKNASGAARTIRFKGNVTPVMFLDKDSDGAINVVVNDAQVK